MAHAFSAGETGLGITGNNRKQGGGQHFFLGFDEGKGSAMKARVYLAALVSGALINGCGTLFSRIDKYRDNDAEWAKPIPLYPAARYDVAMIYERGGIWAYGDCNSGIGPIPATTLHIIDLPISLVTDTLFLPADVWTWCKPADQTTTDGTERSSSL